MAITPRPYQANLSQIAIKTLYSKGLFCLVAPTQTGKTITTGLIMKNGGFKTIFVTPRKFITKQGSFEFEMFFDKNEIAYINANTTPKRIKKILSNRNIKVLVIDIETAISRMKKGVIDVSFFNLVAIDECHYAPNIVKELMSITKNCKQLGITATPHDENGIMIDYYGNIDIIYSAKYMVEKGYLAELLVYYVDIGVRPTLEAMFRATLNKKNQIFNSNSDRALIYVSSIKDAEKVASWYNQYGFKAVAVHSESKEALNDIDRFNRGDFNILISIDMLFMGVVIKNVKASIVMRSISSLNTLVQLSGRSRGHNPHIPNRLFDLTGFSKELGHADDVVLSTGQKTIKERQCVECNTDLKKFPEKTIEVKQDGSYYYALKQCVVCDNRRVTQRTISMKELYDGEVTLKQLDRKTIVQERAKRYIEKSRKQIEKKITDRGFTNKDALLEAIFLNIENKIYKDGEYLSKIDRLLSLNKSNLETMRYIVGYIKTSYADS